MMAWRKWMRAVLEWLGIVAREEAAETSVNTKPIGAKTAVSPPQPSAQPEETAVAKPISAFNLRLLAVGPDRESVIHVLHEMSGLSLRETRALVDSAPVQVLAQIDPHTGRAVQKRLEALGAVCELVGGEATDSVPKAVAGDAAVPATHPDNTFFLFGNYDVVLEEAGPQSEQVVQILRDLLNSRSLADVQRMVEGAPQIIVNQVPLETAVTIQIRLERVGAAVEIVSHKTP
ncbi:MAG: hypothetical protein GY803_12225 [Chloroflexi bacterium]|nr:hypothetical protein [Chloroflexota bacterium]